MIFVAEIIICPKCGQKMRTGSVVGLRGTRMKINCMKCHYSGLPVLIDEKEYELVQSSMKST